MGKTMAIANFCLETLPRELLLCVFQYISVPDLLNISQTCNSLRTVTHTLVYEHCRAYNPLFSTNKRISQARSEIPFPVLFTPDAYSWFPNENVKTVQLSSFYIDLCLLRLPLSNYPSIKHIDIKHQSHFQDKSYTVISNSLTTCDDLLQQSRVFPKTDDLILLIRNKHNMISIPHIDSKMILNCQSVDTRNMVTSLKLCIPDSETVEHSVRMDLGKTFPNLKSLSLSILSWSSDYQLQDVVTKGCKRLCQLEIIVYGVSDCISMLRNFTNPRPSTNFRLIVTGSRNFFAINKMINLWSVTQLYIESHVVFSPDPQTVCNLKSLQVVISPQTVRHYSCKPTFENLVSLAINCPQGVSKYDSSPIFCYSMPKLKNLRVSLVALQRPMRQSTLQLQVFRVIMNRYKFGTFNPLRISHLNQILSDLSDYGILPKKMTYNLALAEVNNFLRGRDSFSEIRSSYFMADSIRHYLIFYFIQIFAAGNQFERRDILEISDSCFLNFHFDSINRNFPNLENLYLSQIRSIEEFPGLHCLVLNHKNLSRVEIDNLSLKPERLNCSDKMYHIFYNCIKSGGTQESEDACIVFKNSSAEYETLDPYYIDVDKFRNKLFSSKKNK